MMGWRGHPSERGSEGVGKEWERDGVASLSETIDWLNGEKRIDDLHGTIILRVHGVGKVAACGKYMKGKVS